MLPYSKRSFSAFPAALILLVLAILAIYQQTFNFGFVFDDHQFIVENTAIRSWGSIFNVFSTSFPLNRLFTIFTFSLNYHLYGLDPQGFHVFNILVHIAAVCSVWWLLRILLVHSFQGPALNENRLNWVAFFGAMLFAVHPAQTQAVSYITQRFSSLSTLFYVLTICFYLRARQSSFRTNKPFFLTMFTVCFCLAILSKEEAGTLPLMIVAIELIFRYRNPKPRYFWVTIVIGLSLFLFLFTILFKNDILTLFSAQFLSESHDGDVLNGKTYLLSQARVFLTFLRLLVWPYPQTIDYDYPMSTSLFQTGVIAGIIIIGGLLLTAFRSKEKSPLLSFGLAWLLISFTANLFPRANLLWEQKIYLISVGALLAFIVILNHLIRSSEKLFCILSMLVIALSIVTFQRNHVWRNDLTLWTDALAKAPHKSRTLLNAAEAYIERGDLKKGLFLLQKAKTLFPSDSYVAWSLGSFYFNQGSFNNAAIEYETASKFKPLNLNAFRYWALSHENIDQYDAALQVYSKALDGREDNAQIYAWRAGVYIKIGQTSKAWDDLVKSLSLAPRNFDALITLIDLYTIEKKYPELEELLRRGAADYPTSEQIYLIRASYYYSKGNIQQARLDINKALELNPYNMKAVAFFNQFMKNQKK